MNDDRISALEDAATSMAQTLTIANDRLNRLEASRMAANELIDNHAIAINRLTNEIADLRNYVYTEIKPGWIKYFDLPLWVYRVSILLQEYEEVHDFKNECLKTALNAIPREVHKLARFLRKHDLLAGL